MKESSLTVSPTKSIWTTIETYMYHLLYARERGRVGETGEGDISKSKFFFTWMKCAHVDLHCILHF